MAEFPSPLSIAIGAPGLSFGPFRGSSRRVGPLVPMLPEGQAYLVPGEFVVTAADVQLMKGK